MTPVLSLPSFTGNRNNIDIFLYNWRALMYIAAWRMCYFCRLRLIQEWAKQTGRYQDGVGSEDYPKWKTRLRCAIHKASDIEEVLELRNTSSYDPHRVFRFKPLSSNPGIIYWVSQWGSRLQKCKYNVTHIQGHIAGQGDQESSQTCEIFLTSRTRKDWTSPYTDWWCRFAAWTVVKSLPCVLQ